MVTDVTKLLPIKCTKCRSSEEGLEPLKCPHCSKVFKKKCNLVLHIEKVHQVGIDDVYSESVPETHKCPVCPRE